MSKFVRILWYLPELIHKVPEMVGVGDEGGSVVEDDSRPHSQTGHQPVPHHPAHLSKAQGQYTGVIYIQVYTM